MPCIGPQAHLCELEDMSKVTLEKEWLCSHFEIVSQNRFVSLFASYPNGGRTCCHNRGNKFPIQLQACLEREQTQIVHPNGL
jgi:hypothetical protein